jgi:hypothetical protein
MRIAGREADRQSAVGSMIIFGVFLLNHGDWNGITMMVFPVGRAGRVP